MTVKKLSDIIGFNSEFRNAINLYLNLNKHEKINSYIPTNSSVDILNRYLNAVVSNKFQSTLLIGPYGKGKSHLLLVLLAILSINRNDENKNLIEGLIERIKGVNENTAIIVEKIWNKKGKFLPVIIMSSQGDLNQSFMIALNDALKRENLVELIPDTFFTYAIDAINRWKMGYTTTYEKYLDLLMEKKITAVEMITELKNCNSEKLEIFKEMYPKLTSGSIFNPLAGSEVLPMYKSVADKLKEDYGYSGIYIIFDEFSKFIEGQDKKAIGNNMKLLQDICELANESKESQIFITMVAHKSIKEYGKYLSEETINSFTGIEGRLEEVLFVTSSKNNYELIQNAIYKDDKALSRIPHAEKYFSQNIIDNYYRILAFRSIFTRIDFEKIVVRGCYPLSPISAYVLLNISEKVAQNERTLFTFISKDEPYSMAKYVNEHPTENGSEWIITLDLIYDYFKNLFKKDVNNEFIHMEWLNAEYALSKVFEYNQKKMIKTLATMSIVNKRDELPTDEEHLILASEIPNAKEVLDELISKNLIYKKGSNNCYVFKTRAGSELKNEIKRRRNLKGDNIHISKVLDQVSGMKYVLPKRYNYMYAMTRYFRYEFMNIIDFLNIENVQVLFNEELFEDGKVLALYNLDDIDYIDEVVKKMEKFKCNNLVVIYSKTKFELLKQVQDYEIIQQIKIDFNFFIENEVLQKELPIFEEDIEKEILKFIDNEFGENSKHKTIYWLENHIVNIDNIVIGKVVDDMCQKFYNKTMVINNELINKEFLTSPPIKKARKTIIECILKSKSNEEYLTGTSAEATIYRAILINTGILSNKYEDNVAEVLQIFKQYLEDCIENKIKLSELLNKVSKAPFGMRKGVFPVILAYVICLRHEDIVVYFNKREVPLTADTILNMCDNPQEYALFISKDNAEKEKYINELSILFEVENNLNLSDSRINNILICMQRWYRALPQVTKNIKIGNSYFEDEKLVHILLKFKNLMQKIEINSYEAIFVDIPEVFDSNKDYEKVINNVRILKQRLNCYFDWLLKKVIQSTIKVFDKKSVDDLNHTLKNWYSKQSNMAKNGLHKTNITAFMNCIAGIKTYDEVDTIQKLVKVVSEIYIDAWNDNSFQEYMNALNEIKEKIEFIKDQENNKKLELKFVGKNGKLVHKYYEKVDESTGAIFRNILEDTLEDFSDLSVNEKVAILLELIEKVMN